MVLAGNVDKNVNLEKLLIIFRKISIFSEGLRIIYNYKAFNFHPRLPSAARAF